MHSVNNIDLSMRAIRCPGFHAMNGMLDIRGVRLNVPNIEQFSVVIVIPDLRDEQTVDCLQELARKALGKPDLEAVHQEDGVWAVQLKERKGAHVIYGRTRAEALVEVLDTDSRPMVY
jgi:hypothetical protein